MKIVIALASSAGQISGVQRHALNLASCLLTRAEITQVHLVAAPWQRKFVEDSGLFGDLRMHCHSAPIGNSALSRNLWFYRGLPLLTARLGADVVHLAYPVPIQRKAFSCPVVATLHDLYPYDIPENFGFPKVLFNRAILRQCLSQVDAIACVSASTLARLKVLDERLAVKKARILYNAVQPQAQLSVEEPVANRDRVHPFLLCVAQHRRNKNILLVLRVLKRLLHHGSISTNTLLVIIGIPGPETLKIESFIADQCLAQHVLLLNGIPEAQLQWCYRHCSALLAPSVIEGFGLPVAEGLIAGCRIVCSDIPAFRELAAKTCHFVPLGAGEEERFAAAIVEALREPRPEPIELTQFAAAAIGSSCLDLYRSQSHSTLRSGLPLQSSFQPTKESRPNR